MRLKVQHDRNPSFIVLLQEPLRCIRAQGQQLAANLRWKLAAHLRLRQRSNSGLGRLLCHRLRKPEGCCVELGFQHRVPVLRVDHACAHGRQNHSVALVLFHQVERQGLGLRLDGLRQVLRPRRGVQSRAHFGGIWRLHAEQVVLRLILHFWASLAGLDCRFVVFCVEVDAFQVCVNWLLESAAWAVEVIGLGLV